MAFYKHQQAIEDKHNHLVQIILKDASAGLLVVVFAYWNLEMVVSLEPAKYHCKPGN